MQSSIFRKLCEPSEVISIFRTMHIPGFLNLILHWTSVCQGTPLSAKSVFEIRCSKTPRKRRSHIWFSRSRDWKKRKEKKKEEKDIRASILFAQVRYRWFQFSRKFQVTHSSNGKGKRIARYEVKTYPWLAVWAVHTLGSSYKIHCCSHNGEPSWGGSAR